MLRAYAVGSARRLAAQGRAFSLSARTMAEGDAGAPRSGGATQGDAFTKREKADEDRFIRQQELNKLKALHQKLADEQKNLSELQRDVDAMIRESDKGEGKK